MTETPATALAAFHELLSSFGLVLTDDPDFDHDDASFGKAQHALIAALRSPAVAQDEVRERALAILAKVSGMPHESATEYAASDRTIDGGYWAKEALDAVEMALAEREAPAAMVEGAAKAAYFGTRPYDAAEWHGMDQSRRDWAYQQAAIRAEIINSPETRDFMAGVPIEAAHQRERWGADHDAGKAPLDWFWLIGYLAQKAATAQMAGDTEKALHHTISTAAALANWHAAISGADNRMRPGIEAPK